MARPVYISSSSVYCAGCENIETVWRNLCEGVKVLSDLPCPAFQGWHAPKVFSVVEPSPALLKVDRKLLRTMELQSKLALYGALLCMENDQHIKKVDKDRIGLYLGLPMVGALVPPWSVLDAIHESGENRCSSDILVHETPSLMALTQLNSSACAHIASTFSITGAMGVYSTCADAGLQAIIEAVLSIQDGENDASLVGGVSKKIQAPRLLEYEQLGWTKDKLRIPGEGTAFLTLNSAFESTQKIRISGYGRGFIFNSNEAVSIYAQIISDALQMAEIQSNEVDWILADTPQSKEIDAFAALWSDHPLLMCSCEDVSGELGPAGPLLNTILAMHGLLTQRRLCLDQADQKYYEESATMKHAVVTAQGPLGQYVAIVLSLESE